MSTKKTVLQLLIFLYILGSVGACENEMISELDLVIRFGGAIAVYFLIKKAAIVIRSNNRRRIITESVMMKSFLYNGFRYINELNAPKAKSSLSVYHNTSEKSRERKFKNEQV